MAKRRLTVGMRCRIKKTSSWYYKHKPTLNEVILQERSGRSFSFIHLGQKKLIKKDPQTVIGGGAWIEEDELTFVNDNFKENLDFLDWYQEHEEDFCPDCGAWYPENGQWERPPCPNPKCPGTKLEKGFCPFCEPEVKLKNDKCPKCSWDADYGGF